MICSLKNHYTLTYSTSTYFTPVWDIIFFKLANQFLFSAYFFSFRSWEILFVLTRQDMTFSGSSVTFGGKILKVTIFMHFATLPLPVL
jgi:hypothetical protein